MLFGMARDIQRLEDENERLKRVVELIGNWRLCGMAPAELQTANPKQIDEFIDGLLSEIMIELSIKQ